MSKDTAIAPARRRGLADEVADRIRAAIFDGTFAPGSPLREVELATLLQVSRGPIREALVQLEREGLARIRWHRGAHVTTLSAQDAEELYTLREALERLAVSRVMTHADGAALDGLDEIVDRMEQAPTPHAVLQLDIEFHDAVYAATRHERLIAAWGAIRSQIVLFLLSRIAVSDDYQTLVPGEHRELVRALRSGPPEHAATLFIAHLRTAYDRLATTL